MEKGRRPISVALSGGGFRATLVGVGVLRQLAIDGQLGAVRHVSSVSGGSIACGLLAVSWNRIRDSGFRVEAFDEHVAQPAIQIATEKSFSLELMRSSWRAVRPGVSRTHLLARGLDRRLFGQRELADLPTGCWFEINAANLTTGARFRFTRDLVGDYISGSSSTAGSGLLLSQAVASSCAVPGVFAPNSLKHPELPCADVTGPPVLVDGGVYDNLGVDALKPRIEMPDQFCVVADSGGVFDPRSRLGRVPLVGPLWRSNGLLYQQTSAVRSRRLVEAFSTRRDGGLDGVLFTLRTNLSPAHGATGDLARFLSDDPGESRAGSDELASFPTTFGRLSLATAKRLVARGSWLTRGVLLVHAPEFTSACTEPKPL